ncbi:MAG: hypothetical protein A4E38_00016 [Methanoregulaceae archaeon PtaB.Bin108]|nr:MAG: hypothetical protein A4E38_00016 [Methanoregulaceae archaeon PtaB.Bin108]
MSQVDVEVPGIPVILPCAVGFHRNCRKGRRIPIYDLVGGIHLLPFTALAGPIKEEISGLGIGIGTEYPDSLTKVSRISDLFTDLGIDGDNPLLDIDTDIVIRPVKVKFTDIVLLPALSVNLVSGGGSAGRGLPLDSPLSVLI